MKARRSPVWPRPSPPLQSSCPAAARTPRPRRPAVRRAAVLQHDVDEAEGVGDPQTAEAPAGPNPTIADYIKENDIQETGVKMGDPTRPRSTFPSRTAGSR